MNLGSANRNEILIEVTDTTQNARNLFVIYENCKNNLTTSTRPYYIKELIADV